MGLGLRWVADGSIVDVFACRPLPNGRRNALPCTCPIVRRFVIISSPISHAHGAYFWQVWPVQPGFPARHDCRMMSSSAEKGYPCLGRCFPTKTPSQVWIRAQLRGRCAECLNDGFCSSASFVLFCFVWLATLGMPVVAPGTAAGPFRRVVEAP